MLTTDRSQWVFRLASEVKANLEACGGASNPLIRVPNPVVYLDTNGKRIYVGKSTDLRRRYRQHMGYIAGGGRSTKGMRNKSVDNRIWCVAVITGFENEQQAYQFEYRCHKFKRKLHKSAVFEDSLLENIRAACASASKKVSQFGLKTGYIEVLYRCLTLNQWTKGAPEAVSVPLTIHWFDPTFRPTIPHTGDHPYLMTHVSQRDATIPELQHLYYRRPREKAVQSAKIASRRHRS